MIQWCSHLFRINLRMGTMMRYACLTLLQIEVQTTQDAKPVVVFCTSLFLLKQHLWRIPVQSEIQDKWKGTSTSPKVTLKFSRRKSLFIATCCSINSWGQITTVEVCGQFPVEIWCTPKKIPHCNPRRPYEPVSHLALRLTKKSFKLSWLASYFHGFFP